MSEMWKSRKNYRKERTRGVREDAKKEAVSD
jgi:hypothetical protein